MATFNIWILLAPFIVVSTIFGIGILFARKKYRLWFARLKFKEKALDIIIITKNKNLFHGVVGIVQDTFKYNNEDYMIDEETVYTEKFLFAQRPYSVYLEGNPKPLKFDFKTGKADFSSLDLKSFAESKLIQQLLNTNEEKMIMILMVMVVFMLVGLGILGYLFVNRTDMMIDLLNTLNTVLTR